MKPREQLENRSFHLSVESNWFCSNCATSDHFTLDFVLLHSIENRSVSLQCRLTACHVYSSRTIAIIQRKVGKPILLGKETKLAQYVLKLGKGKQYILRKVKNHVIYGEKSYFLFLNF